MAHIKSITIDTRNTELTLGQILSVVAQMMSVVGTTLISKEADDEK